MQKTLSIFNRIVNEFLSEEQEHPVAEHIPSTELFDRLDLELKQNPMNEEEFEKILSELVLSSTRTATNGFFNQLYGGRNEKAVLGDLLAVILNNSMYTYKAAGAQIGVEKSVIREVCNMLGWNQHSDGTFASGGSMTNFMAMLMARDSRVDDIRFTGATKKMTVYTSDISHYSIPKNASFAGIGRNNVRYIPTDNMGRMIPEALEKQITEDLQNNCIPVLVNTTAGTTVLGAFDPIDEISAICKKYEIWLHVDGAYSGAVIFSKKYHFLLKGVEEADSFSFNAHKMIGTPLTCSLLMVKEKKHLFASFDNAADYLYQTDQDEFNLGKTSLQCGRRNDALKFWTLWKSVGTEGLEKIVDHQFDLADIARTYIRENPDYTLYSFDNSISICFNYRNISAKKLCNALYEHDKLLVAYGTHKEYEFVRLVTINAQNKKDDILQFFTLLEDFVANHPELF